MRLFRRSTLGFQSRVRLPLRDLVDAPTDDPKLRRKRPYQKIASSLSQEPGVAVRGRQGKMDWRDEVRRNPKAAIAACRLKNGST